MTIRVQGPNLFDKILSLIGKKRGIIVPYNVYERYGPFAYGKAKRESFWKALLRPLNAPFPDGVIEWDQVMGNFKTDFYRREVLFSHHLLTFIEYEFPGALFGDDFQGRSKTELYFIYNDAFYLLESKSEAETEDPQKHPGWQGTFQEVRDAIRKLGFNNQYNKWLLYLAQLNDYASPTKRLKKAQDYSERYAILGLPVSKLPDCQQVIDMTIKKLSISVINYTPRQDNIRQVAYVLMKETDLSVFIQKVIKGSTLSS